MIENDLRELGTMKTGEKLTLFVFVFVALAWIFRRNIDLGAFVIPGWYNMLGIDKYVHQSSVKKFLVRLEFERPAVQVVVDSNSLFL